MTAINWETQYDLLRNLYQRMWDDTRHDAYEALKVLQSGHLKDTERRLRATRGKLASPTLYRPEGGEGPPSEDENDFGYCPLLECHEEVWAGSLRDVDAALAFLLLGEIAKADCR